MSPEPTVASPDDPDGPDNIDSPTERADLQIVHIGSGTLYTSYVPASGSNFSLGDAYAATPSSATETHEHSEVADYMDSLVEEIKELNKKSKRRLRNYRLLRFSGLVMSSAVPVLALLDAPGLVTAVVGVYVIGAEGLIQLTRMHERGVIEMQRLGQLGREYRMFRTRAGDYEAGDRLSLFVKRIEEIRSENDGAVLNVLKQTFTAPIVDNGHVQTNTSQGRSQGDTASQ